MLQRLLIAAAFVLNGVCSIAQVTAPQSNEDKMLAYSPTELRFRTPLYVVNADDRVLYIPSAVKSGDVVSGNIPDISTRWMKSIRVVAAQDAVALYGEPGRNGAVIVELKDGVFEKLPTHLANRFTLKK